MAYTYGTVTRVHSHTMEEGSRLMQLDKDAWLHVEKHIRMTFDLANDT